MAGFDEMLALEDRQRRLQERLEIAKNEVRESSITHADYEREIKTVTKRIENLRQNWASMKKARVCSLQEWTRTQRQLEEAIERRLEYQITAQKLAQKNKLAAGNVPILEAQLREIEKQLSAYGQVIHFPGTSHEYLRDQTPGE